LLHNYLRGKTCRAYYAPFDVQLNPDGADDTVLQPDLTIICDGSKFTDRGCKGAPDMVVEILSPSTEKFDLTTKLDRYLEAGVRECWIIDPNERKLRVYLTQEGITTVHRYDDKAKVRIGIFEDCVVDLASVFPPEEAERADAT
jgi:Uma2 family endonuclease